MHPLELPRLNLYKYTSQVIKGAVLSRTTLFEVSCSLQSCGRQFRGQRMASLRRVSYLLIILFFLDVSFIDHVATQCGVHWRPAGEDWANTWDGMLLFSCPKGKSIRRIHSIHRNCIEDRIWAFSCESNSAAQVCSWTGFVNSYDDLLNFKCPNNGFISGIYSVHSNKREDRRFEFKCCHSSSYSRHSCKWSHTTNWDADIDYSTTWGWLAGAHSYHNNHYEDRRWQFYQCKKI